MTNSRLSLIFIAVCSLLIGGVHSTVHSTPALTAVAAADNLSAATNKQLAQARRGTAKYHDIEAAEADGYVNIIAQAHSATSAEWQADPDLSITAQHRLCNANW